MGGLVLLVLMLVGFASMIGAVVAPWSLWLRLVVGILGALVLCLVAAVLTLYRWLNFAGH